MAESKDLWPDFDKVEQFRSPKAILAEQATFLMGKTKNVIIAKVETETSNDGGFYQNFIIQVPALNNYSYELFFVKHDVLLYPLTVRWEGKTAEAIDEKQFVEVLAQVFSSMQTKKIITSLYAQAIE